VSLVVSRSRTIGLGEIGRDRATGKSSGGRSIWRGDRAIRFGRVGGDWTAWTAWDRNGGDSGVGNWNFTASVDESGARFDGWDLRLRSISGSWTIWDRTGGLGESGRRRAARLWEPSGDLTVWRGEIGGGRTGRNSGIRVDWVIAASRVGIWVGSVGFIVGSGNVWDRTGWLWKISWRWATGLREPSGDRSIGRWETSGRWSRGDSRIMVDWVVAASGVRVLVGSVGFVVGNWNTRNRTGGLGKSGWRRAAGLGEPTRDRSARRGEIGGGRTGGNRRLGGSGVITASGVWVWVGTVRFIVGNWNVWDRAAGLGKSGRWWTTGLWEPSGNRSIRRGEISGGWSRGNSRIRVDWIVATSGVWVWVGSVRFIVGSWNIRDRTGGLGKSGRWWTTGLREPSRDRSTRRREGGGRRTRGNILVRDDRSCH
jgi:hypothetical protein